MTDKEVNESGGSEEGRMGVVVRCSPSLTGGQRRYLRGLGHHLKPVVWVGDRGWHEGVQRQIEIALLRHELIKVKARGATPPERAALAEAIHGATGAQVAQIVGRMILVYQAHPEKPQIVLPGAKSRGK